MYAEQHTRMTLLIITRKHIQRNTEREKGNGTNINTEKNKYMKDKSGQNQKRK